MKCASETHCFVDLLPLLFRQAVEHAPVFHVATLALGSLLPFAFEARGFVLLLRCAREGTCGVVCVLGRGGAWPSEARGECARGCHVMRSVCGVSWLVSSCVEFHFLVGLLGGMEVQGASQGIILDALGEAESRIPSRIGSLITSTIKEVQQCIYKDSWSSLEP